MIPTKTFNLPNGKTIEVPYLEWKQKKSNVVMYVFGTNDQLPQPVNLPADVLYTNIGKVSELMDARFRVSLTTDLLNAGWDFSHYPDPQIVILTDQKEANNDLTIVKSIADK